jgi:F-type H+/Na+-transporting ATPase subunit alpha
MGRWEIDLLKYMDVSHPEIGRNIAESKRITEENEKKLREALSAFNATWQA